MSNDVAILGVGMHPWGKWGRNFVEYGITAARDALADAGLAWTDVQFVSGADTIRNGYPGFVAGATFAQALGWSGARVSSCYAACASGAHAIDAARAQILAGLCDVALVVGADTTPKGFFAPVGGDRQDDPDWLRFRLLGATNPSYFALYARRRMALYGATDEDFAQVKVKNARHGLDEPQRPVPQGGHRSRRCWRRRWSPTRCACSRSAPRATGARPSCSAAWTTPAAAARARRCGSRRSRPSRRPVPEHVIEMPNFATDSAAVGRAAPPVVPRLDRGGGLRGSRHRPRRPRPRRGLRPVHRARARLVREHRAVQGGRGREAAARR